MSHPGERVGVLISPTDAAMALVERWSAPDAGGGPERRWLGPAAFDSYNAESNRLTVWVLEGSPARGVVIRYADGSALALSMFGGRKRIFRAPL